MRIFDNLDNYIIEVHIYIVEHLFVYVYIGKLNKKNLVISTKFSLQIIFFWGRIVFIAPLEANRNTRTRTCGSDERLMLPPDRGGVPVVQSAPPLHCDIILGYCGASNPLADICQNQLPGYEAW